MLVALGAGYVLGTDGVIRRGGPVCELRRDHESLRVEDNAVAKPLPVPEWPPSTANSAPMQPSFGLIDVNSAGTLSP